MGDSGTDWGKRESTDASATLYEHFVDSIARSVGIYGRDAGKFANTETRYAGEKKSVVATR